MGDRRWLMKSEPEAFGWDDLVRDGETLWDGVRNHRAANNLRAMQVGDLAFFYHSVTGKEIVGIAKVSEAGLVDPNDDRWAAVKVKPVRAMPRPVTLKEIKADPSLAEMELVRLSACPSRNPAGRMGPGLRDGGERRSELSSGTIPASSPLISQTGGHLSASRQGDRSWVS